MIKESVWEEIAGHHTFQNIDNNESSSVKGLKRLCLLGSEDRYIRYVASMILSDSQKTEFFSNDILFSFGLLLHSSMELPIFDMIKN